MKDRIEEYVITHPLRNRLIKTLKRIRFRGGKVSLFFIFKIFIEKLQKDEILERANAVAFSFTIAVFPAVIMTH